MKRLNFFQDNLKHIALLQSALEDQQSSINTKPNRLNEWKNSKFFYLPPGGSRQIDDERRSQSDVRNNDDSDKDVDRTSFI